MATGKLGKVGGAKSSVAQRAITVMDKANRKATKNVKVTGGRVKMGSDSSKIRLAPYKKTKAKTSKSSKLY